MKTREPQEDQKQFLQQQSTDDTFYLKNYVKQHPDNKMAWYFLGRNYESKGNHRKALYCFAQSGEVYEAFEAESLSLIFPSQDTKSKSRKSSKLSRGLGMLILLLILCLVPNLTNPHEELSGTQGKMKSYEEKAWNGQHLLYNRDWEYNTIERAFIFYLSDQDVHKGLGHALRYLTISAQHGSQTLDYSVVVKPSFSLDHVWREWLGSTRILLEARHNTESDIAIQYLDPELCQCVPGDSAYAQSVFEDWRGQQEGLFVLRTAILAYKEAYNRLPPSIDSLVQPYPNNRLSGYTPFMQESFAAMTEQVNSLSSMADGSQVEAFERSDEVGMPEGILLESLQDSMHIIIDKAEHRLAVVSGDIMLRSYPVGLGGERTPLGEFTISERVKNPNGRSDGEFGSRGMTLSDTLYAIHGTNQPESIGQDRSLGCIRMHNEHVEELFDLIPLGTQVRIVENSLSSSVWIPTETFSLPALTSEENPHKTYRWLN